MLNRTDYERPGWLEWLDPANPDDNWMSKMSYELYGGTADAAIEDEIAE